jgi:hypothetical protein
LFPAATLRPLVLAGPPVHSFSGLAVAHASHVCIGGCQDEIRSLAMTPPMEFYAKPGVDFAGWLPEELQSRADFQFSASSHAGKRVSPSWSEDRPGCTIKIRAADVRFGS